MKGRYANERKGWPPHTAGDAGKERGSRMNVYESLSDRERAAIERAIDALEAELGRSLARDDRAARAAEALAVYVKESADKP